jgi:NTP pyrophosphatase (non-canonical NTP hydrolase)
MGIGILELQNLLVKKEFLPNFDFSKEGRTEVLLHLLEEIGELIKVYRREGITTEKFNDEIGDCQLLLLYFSIVSSTNLEFVTLNKLKKNMKKIYSEEDYYKKMQFLDGLFY